MNKWMVAVVGIAGFGALVMLMREKSASAQPQVLPIPTAAQIPSYPAPPPLPAFTVNATPTYQTINIAPSVQPAVKVADDSKKPASSCSNQALAVSTPIVSSNRVQRSLSNLASVPNIQAQFPPALYPWLYQNGGSA